MKRLHQLFKPSSWSFTTRLAAVMLSVTVLPLFLLLAYQPLCPDHRVVLMLGAIAATGALFLAHYIAQPIFRLTKVARLVERGNLTSQGLAEIVHAPNNIGLLARVFSQLIASVRAAQEQHIRQQISPVLLKELNHRDLEWLIAVGHCRELAPGTVLVQAGKRDDRLHVILDGTVAPTITAQTGAANVPSRFNDAAVAHGAIAQFGSGEVIGERSVLDATVVPTVTIQVIESALVLSLEQAQLAPRLQQNREFAARFYRAIAILIANRVHQLVSQLGCTTVLQDQSLRDALFILSALNDSDIDWLVENGERQKILANTVLIHQDRPVDALYILLNGTLAISTFHEVCNPFVRAFSTLAANRSPGQEITQLSKGEMVGEIPFLTTHLPSTTVTALEDSLVLAISRSRLTIKLEQDPGFASRFYHMLADLQSNRLQDLLNRLGCVEQVEAHNHSLNGAIQADELNFNVLDQMAIAGTRFDWMLKRLQGIEPV